MPPPPPPPKREASDAWEEAVWEEMGSVTESQFDAAVEGGLETMRKLEEAKAKKEEGDSAAAMTQAGPARDDDDDDDNDIVVVIPASATAGQFFPLNEAIAARLPRVEIAPGYVAVPGFIVKKAEAVASSSRANAVVLRADPDLGREQKKASAVSMWLALAFFFLLVGLSISASRAEH